MLSEQIEEYLEAIGRLEERDEPITTSSLARERGVAPPSATEMLGRMAGRGLISYQPRGEITLTQEGRSVARSMMRRHRLWERFLHDFLGVRWDRVHEEACKLEHATSDEVEAGLARAIGDLPTCPHGHLIPDGDGGGSRMRSISLLSLAPGETARVISIRDEEPAVLGDLQRIGLKPGIAVRADDAADGADPVMVQIGDNSYPVSRRVAGGIRVDSKSEPGETQLPLAQLGSGETATVTRLVGGNNFVSQCLALGFTPGVQVTVIRNPKNGPLLVQLRDTRVALGRREAQRIQLSR